MAQDHFLIDMGAKNRRKPSLLRYDWLLYLAVIAGLLTIFVGEVSAALSNTPAAGASQVAAVDLGAVYAIVVWLVIPATVFVVCNLRQARRFREKLGEQPARTAAPARVVEPEIPTVRAKKRATGSVEP